MWLEDSKIYDDLKILALRRNPLTDVVLDQILSNLSINYAIHSDYRR